MAKMHRFLSILSTKGCISLTIDDAGRLHCCVARVTIVLDVASAAGVLRTTEGACLAFIAVSVNYTTCLLYTSDAADE